MNQDQLIVIKRCCYFLLFWLTFQTSYSLAKYYQHQQQVSLSQLNIEKRIALDISKIPLANSAFNIVAHEPSIKDYITQLNTNLAQQKSPIRLLMLQDIRVESNPELITLISELSLSEQKIGLVLGVAPWPLLTTLNPLALFLAMFFSFWNYKLNPSSATQKEEQEDRLAEMLRPKLSINLHNKTLSSIEVKSKVELSNKPFCFYAALIEYCIKEPQPYLNQSKDVPEDIIALANKYFYRLIELGHTKRKRPDFSTNLDKTLSEIRAALDLVFLHQTKDKEMFYPPKAQGEGSRSKRHNYALEHLDMKKVEIIGK